MSGKPKTRFLVHTQHGVRELFSVLERPSNGYLIILCRVGQNYEDPIRGNVGIVSEKFSIHTSDNSEGTTIVRTNPLEDGRPLSSSAFIANSKSDLLYPIFGQYAPKLQLDRYVAVVKPKDRVIDVAKYNDDRSTLIFTVVVSSLDRIPPAYPDGAGNLLSVEFLRFRLSVYYAFMNVGAMVWHDVAIAATSEQQEIPNPIKPESGGDIPFTDERAQFFIDTVAATATKKYYDRIANYGLPLGDDTLQLIQQHARMVLRMPFEELEQLNNKLPVVFASSLPLCDGAKGVIVHSQGQPVGKIFLHW